MQSPDSHKTRPTPDRVREALFSILGDLQGAVVVDGFAGSGALGCEALSRGAAFCSFIEPSGSALQAIRENIRRIDARASSEVLQGNFEAQLAAITRDPDLWLLDPPYQMGLGARALAAMREARCVSAGALVVLEQDVDEALLEVEGFALEDQRLYGRTRLCFYRRADDMSA